MIYKIKTTRIIKEVYNVESDTMDDAAKLLNTYFEIKGMNKREIINNQSIEQISHSENILSMKGVYEEYKEENF